VAAVRAQLWLLDEPFTNLDSVGSRLVAQLLEQHVDRGGSAVVVAHHDLELARPVRRLELAG
jgi:heme exporter protein A